MPVDKQWEEIVDRLYDPIFRFCLHLLGDAADAGDATQQAFLQAFQSAAPDKLDDHRAWLYAIARNCCADRRRAFARIARLPRLFFPERSADPVSPIGRALLNAVQRLPRMQREVFLLREWHDFSTESAADLLGISAGAVKSHLSRAKHSLRASLGGQATDMPEVPSSKSEDRDD